MGSKRVSPLNQMISMWGLCLGPFPGWCPYKYNLAASAEGGMGLSRLRVVLSSWSERGGVLDQVSFGADLDCTAWPLGKMWR